MDRLETMRSKEVEETAASLSICSLQRSSKLNDTPTGVMIALSPTIKGQPVGGGQFLEIPTLSPQTVGRLLPLISLRNYPPTYEMAHTLCVEHAPLLINPHLTCHLFLPEFFIKNLSFIES